ncbi:chain length determinant protein tyrosine kinase EpsG [Glaciimonas immobilis]|uniref:Chain length determinant protein tyrosine kinase EpsG n=1 Tax=Glaciimonas immobilis TaxID=728004 RepID=A0A840RQN2_9BURK|nr:chain length determinant protein tyrosine kinase EpsG [Glaciimonas immobilis]KAF3998019.1 chain length determinant protein tyrosine kinase EpsG [Glaciimonas immobilis]MBB5199298.1 chain length determinant protein tyrosine kinase EpsG [Glaciimonas immobilis]
MTNPVTSIIGSAAPITKDANIGSMLVKQGKITHEQAERVRHLQNEEGLRFGDAAIRLGLVCASDIQQIRAHQLDYPFHAVNSGTYPPPLTAASQPFSAEVEMLRNLRDQLMQRWFATGHKKLAIVTVNPGDGTSMLAANLSVVFSQLGNPTLLVDANLRHPRQHKIFSLDGRRGLSEALAGHAGLDLLIRAETFLDLSILPAGSSVPNPQQLLNRSAFGVLNERLCDCFDIILYDTPAFLSATDCLTIASRAGGALLVVRKNHTRVADLTVFSGQLRRSGTEIVGSVMVSF